MGDGGEGTVYWSDVGGSDNDGTLFTPGSGPGTGRWLRITRNTWFVEWFGGDLDAAILAIGSDNITLVISSTVTLAQNTTAPANVELVFTRGGLIVDAGFDLTINGQMSAGSFPIFSGTGTVVIASIKSQTIPQWFGATGDGVTDDTAAVLKVIATNSGKYHYPRGTYLVDPDAAGWSADTVWSDPFTAEANANILYASETLTGTITVASGSADIVGSGTFFLALAAGDTLEWIDDAAATKTGVISSFNSASQITLTGNADSVATAVVVKRINKTFDIGGSLAGGLKFTVTTAAGGAYYHNIVDTRTGNTIMRLADGQNNSDSHLIDDTDYAGGLPFEIRRNSHYLLTEPWDDQNECDQTWRRSGKNTKGSLKGKIKVISGSTTVSGFNTDFTVLANPDVISFTDDAGAEQTLTIAFLHGA